MFDAVVRCAAASVVGSCTALRKEKLRSAGRSWRGWVRTGCARPTVVKSAAAEQLLMGGRGSNDSASFPPSMSRVLSLVSKFS